MNHDVIAPGRIEFRDAVSQTDVDIVRRLCESTEYFHAHEVDVAVELVDERLAKGRASGYEFIFAHLASPDGRGRGVVVGYSCYGLIACTRSSFDLYWLVVGKAWQRTGLGRAILDESVRRMRAMGAMRVYAETSSRAQYQSTRAFYERCGFTPAAMLDDFYDVGDGKVVYVKRM